MSAMVLATSSRVMPTKDRASMTLFDNDRELF